MYYNVVDDDVNVDTCNTCVYHPQNSPLCLHCSIMFDPISPRPIEIGSINEGKPPWPKALGLDFHVRMKAADAVQGPQLALEERHVLLTAELDEWGETVEVGWEVDGMIPRGFLSCLYS